VLLTLLSTVACRQDMHDQPKYIPLRPSSTFADGRSARPIPAGTVARGHLDEDTAFYSGKKPDGTFLEAFPLPVTKELLLRGQQRYNVFCSPCHDRTGGGLGMVVRRGFRQPPSYHIDRLRESPNGYLFDVITNGFGAMPDFAVEIQPPDRWAIVAYVRGLQLAERATIDDVPGEARAQLTPGGLR
jgi:mono/diheme cytochrome c family protein